METESQIDGTDVAPELTAALTRLAALWRRWLAFLIDWIILSIGGYVVGALLFDPLARWGVWTRVLGFAIAVVYFGLFDSGWGGAGSPGKKVLSLRVVDDSGRVIGMGRSLLRAALICAPLILNNFFAMPPEGAWGMLGVNGLFGGWLQATLYMLLFNRRTKQGLHDLATHTFVVQGRASRQMLSGLTPWRPHFIIAIALFALSVPLAMARFPIFLHFAPGVSQVAHKAPDDGPVQVLGATMTWKLTHDQGTRPECLHAIVQLAGAGVVDEQLAKSAATQLIARYRCRVVAHLAVRLQYGFDMGFSSGTAYHDFLIDEADLTH